jgi:hypothetical protein
MAFAFRSSARARGVPSLVDTRQSLRLASSCLSDWGGTRGEPSSYCTRFIVPEVTVTLCLISPGRFFAVNEAKALLAHIVVTYDFKFEERKGVPPDLCIAALRVPGSANVLFRVRQK